MPYNQLMFEFIEAPHFTKQLRHYLDLDEYAEIQEYLNEHPNSGVVIPGSGGVRKLRWHVGSQGKRGGLRVIYYLQLSHQEIWLLTIYGKNVQENIPAHLLKQMREAIEDEQDD